MGEIKGEGKAAPRLVPRSRNARPQKGLVRRPQSAQSRGVFPGRTSNQRVRGAHWRVYRQPRSEPDGPLVEG